MDLDRILLKRRLQTLSKFKSECIPKLLPIVGDIKRREYSFFFTTKEWGDIEFYPLDNTIYIEKFDRIKSAGYMWIKKNIIHKNY